MAFKTDFRPDVIAGNVPYSSGLDIDFIYDAYEVSRYGICEITPAKCFVADATQRIDSTHSYGDFQEQIVPTIDRLVFYPDAAEVFEIRNADGITIYTCNKSKDKEDNCTVINRNLHQKYFNSTEKRNITNRATLHNCGYRLTEQLSSFDRFTFPNITGAKRFQVYTGTKINGGCGWGFANRKDPCSTFNLQGAMRCLGGSVIADTEKGEVDSREYSICTFESDDINECESFISWLDTKLIRFLVMINISKLSRILTDDYFRFVPKPFKSFSNGLYTDSEMYTYYNIDNSTIDIIENTIIKG
jgi:hypothetical protein